MTIKLGQQDVVATTPRDLAIGYGAGITKNASTPIDLSQLEATLTQGPSIDVIHATFLNGYTASVIKDLYGTGTKNLVYITKE